MAKRNGFGKQAVWGSALILGGGGPIGIAWEAGLVLGLRDRGIDLARADRIVGTSAGSIVGAHVAVRGCVDELYQAQATPLDASIKPPHMAPLLVAMMKSKLFARSMENQRKSIGKSARTANVDGEAEWLRAIAGFLPTQNTGNRDWPMRDLHVTAIDSESGELVAWTRTSGVPLEVAVASSCAVPCVYPLVHIRERVYMDGGMGSSTNAALGKGCALVMIADPLARLPGMGSSLLAEQKMLEGQGSHVITFTFDKATQNLVGMNLMDASKRGRVAALGRAQGQMAAATHLALGTLGGR